MRKIDLTSKTLVECMIKRSGGTTVPFGFNAASQVVYEFLPIDVNDQRSPHIADVKDADHYNRLIKIREAYRPYVHGQTKEQILHIAKPDEDEDFNPQDQFDLLSVDLDLVSNDWLQSFSKQVLEIPPTSKSKLTDYAKTKYELTFDKAMTANEMIKRIAVERKIEEENAHKAAIDDLGETESLLGEVGSVSQDE